MKLLKTKYFTTMIPLTIIMAFLTTIITLFFNFLFNPLRTETKNTYAMSIQNFIKEVKKDFSDKPAKKKMKKPDNFERSLDKVKV